jgi:hypothetical protein
MSLSKTPRLFSAKGRQEAALALNHFKRLDANAIRADCRDLVEQHGLDFEATRQAIKAMLDEQPAPRRGAT